MKTFGELIHDASWPEVQKELLRLYPEEVRSINGYYEVFNELLSLSPVPNKDGYIIKVSFVDTKHIDEEDDSHGYYDVSGYKPDEDQGYGIEFTPWQEWLSFSVDQSSLNREGALDIIAHCLYEMTFCGFDQEVIQGEFSHLLELKDEAMKSHELLEEDEGE